MKYSFSKKRLIFNLILGVFWLFYGISYIIGKDTKWFHFGFLAIGITYISMTIYESLYKYFEITDSEIKINGLPTSKIPLDQLTEVKYFAGDYIFKSKTKTIQIAKSQIDKKYQQGFEIKFQEIKLKFEL